MASLPGLATLFLARIPLEAQQETIHSFIDSLKPRDGGATDFANVKLGLELLRVCPYVSDSALKCGVYSHLVRQTAQESLNLSLSKK